MSMKKYPADFLITQRRKEEMVRNEYIRATKYFEKTESKCNFERVSESKYIKNQIERRFKELKEQQQSRLQERRQKLADLFSREQAINNQIIADNAETKEDRIDKMRQRVQELKAKREEERLKLVEEKLTQCWRNNAEEIRAVTSKLLEKDIARQQLKQIREKQASLAQIEKENEHYHALWEEDRLRKIAREQQEIVLREKRNAETVLMLDEQMEAIRRKNAEQIRLKHEEAMLMLQELENRRMEEDRKRMQREEQQRKVREDLDRFNRRKMAEKNKKIQEQLAWDLEFLAAIEKMDEERKRAEKQRHDVYRKDVELYRQHLVEQQIIEKQREREIELLIQEDMENKWKEKEVKWKKEQEARDRLIAEVLESRQIQIQERINANKNRQRQLRAEQEEIARSVEADREFTRQQRIKTDHELAEYRRLLGAQIQDLRERRRAEEEKIQREVDAIISQQKMYTERLKREIALEYERAAQ